MRLLRRDFSLRTLLVAVATIGAGLALTIRFGPHLVWRTFCSEISRTDHPISTYPLVDAQPDDELVTCQVGPLWFEVPRSLTNAIDVTDSSSGGTLILHDGNRSLIVRLPRPASHLLQEDITDFSEKAARTFPRLYMEIAESHPDDFSYGMSRRELQWHKWLLTKRSQLPVDSIEYSWRSDMEGILYQAWSLHEFQWETVDSKWEGTMIFKSSNPDGGQWIRHACVSLTINGDLSVIRSYDAAAVRSMIKILPCGETTPTKNRSVAPDEQVE